MTAVTSPPATSTATARAATAIDPRVRWRPGRAGMVGQRRIGGIKVHIAAGRGLIGHLMGEQRGVGGQLWHE